jgi:transcriptional regulator with XRE-family HTH domain
MEAAVMVRAARRRAGLSQRGLAERAGVSGRTVAAIESGRVVPRSDTLADLLAVAGLELAPAASAPAEDDELLWFLALSLTDRLRYALRDEAPGRTATAQRRLVVLGAFVGALGPPRSRAAVSLTGTGGLCVWLPEVRAPWPLPVTVHQWPGRLPEVEGLVVTRSEDPPALGGVPVAVATRSRVWCPGPLDLSVDPACAASAGRLLTVVAVLHADMGLDDAGRRPPPHRDPDEQAELERVTGTRAYGMRPPVPRLLDSRSWRIGAPASARQVLIRAGYPDVGWRARLPGPAG